MTHCSERNTPSRHVVLIASNSIHASLSRISVGVIDAERDEASVFWSSEVMTRVGCDALSPVASETCATASRHSEGLPRA